MRDVRYIMLIVWMLWGICQFGVAQQNVDFLFEIEDAVYGNGKVGAPDLPTISRLVNLPKGSSISINTARGEMMEIRAEKRLPTRDATIKDADEPVYIYDKEIYTTDSYYRGGQLAEVQHLGTMGDEELFRVVVRPMDYNPVKDSVRYYRSVSVSLKINITEDQQALLNVPTRYLIVSRPLFRDGLRPFVQWKRQEGYEVKELYVDTNHRDSVKMQMRPFFDNATAANPAPRYILIVGDASEVQAYIGTTRPEGLSTHPTDLYYADYSGDYLPEAIVGRWPVSDTATLRRVVDKTISYERFENLDTAALNRALLVAGYEDNSPAPTTTNGQVNYLGHEIVSVHPEVDTLVYHNPDSKNHRQDILQNIAAGAAMVNYTAHCTRSGWSSPSIGYGSIDTLDIHQPMLYVNNCCLSNEFTGNCFGEQLFRRSRGGAIGVIGATNSTLWNEDYYWAVGPKYPFSLTPMFDSAKLGAFDRWPGRAGGVRTQGELLIAGNMAVSAFGSPYDRFYWEIYCLFGDPALMPYIGRQEDADLEVCDTCYHEGDTRFEANARPGAKVTVVQGEKLLGVAMADDSGRCRIDLLLPIDTLPLIVTATGSGIRPETDTVTIVGGWNNRVTFRDIEVSETIVNCKVVNIGSDALTDLHVALIQNSTMGATINGNIVDIATLNEGDEACVAIAITMTEAGQYPIWQASLTAYTTDTFNSIALCHSLPTEYPKAKFVLRNIDSTTAKRIDPNENYLLDVGIAGTYDSMRVNISTLPVSLESSHLLTLGSNVIPITTPADIEHLHIAVVIYYGNYSESYDYWMIAGNRNEGFENGYDCYPWRIGGTRPWSLDSVNQFNGNQAARTGVIGHRQTTTLMIDVLLPADDSVVFWSRPSSEIHDKLYFYVDGTQRGERWGIGEWRRDAYNIAAGSHTLKWIYVKDETMASGSDCAWLDDLRLPFSLWDAPYGCHEDDSVGIGIVKSHDNRIEIYPNPASDRVTMKARGERIEMVEVTDLYGRKLMSRECDAEEVELRLTLQDGIYMVVAKSEGGLWCKKLIINRVR